MIDEQAKSEYNYNKKIVFPDNGLLIIATYHGI